MSNGLNSENADEKQVSIVYREKMPRSHRRLEDMVVNVMLAAITVMILGCAYTHYLAHVPYEKGVVRSVAHIGISDTMVSILKIRAGDKDCTAFVPSFDQEYTQGQLVNITNYVARNNQCAIHEHGKLDCIGILLVQLLAFAGTVFVILITSSC